MFFGKYSLTISKDGMVFLFADFKDKIEVGMPYNVILRTDHEEDGIYSLIYRFNNDVYENEKVLKKYNVRKDKFLRIPPSFRDTMTGRCFLIGVGNDIELTTFESETKRESQYENMSFENLMEEFKSISSQK